jgi:zinc protease
MAEILDRSKKPDPQGKIKFNLPKIERFKLKNKLDVLFVHKDNLPFLRFNLISASGSKFDPMGKKGLSNLFSMVLDEGAGKYNSIELSEEFEILGSRFNISCFSDNIHLSLQTLTDNLNRSLELFATVISQPHLDEKSFERERRKIITTIKQLQDSPEDIADIAFDRILFHSENPYAYPIIGYIEDINRISTSDIRNIYQNNFDPESSTLIVVGDSTKQQLEEKMDTYLSDWKSGNKNYKSSLTPKEEALAIYLVHKEGSVQSEIRIGHLSGKRNDKEFFAKHLLNLMLGGQFSSRINLNLRENKGYTYGATSRFNYLKDASQFIVSTSVGSENTGNAIKEILKELNEIKNGISHPELDFAKSSIIRRYPGNFETHGQITANLASLVLHSLPDNYFDTYIDNISHLKIEDINNAALTSIHPDRLTILVVGDKNLVLPQLKSLNISEVVQLDMWGKVII